MKIGVDGGALSITDDRLKVGVYRVVYNLLRELGKINTENTYYIYSFIPIDREVMQAFGPRMINKVLRPQKGWFSLRLPLELSLNPVDLFLGTSQAVSSSTSHNIGFIYDLGFLYYPDAYPGSYEKLKKQTEHLVRKSHRIIAISHSAKSDIEKELGLPGENITVAYPGVDSRFTKEGKTFKGKHPYFLFVGALKPGKNVPSLVKAFAEFLQKEKKVYDLYLIGGNFWNDPKIEKEIHAYKLEERVKKLGFVLDEDLPSYYRGAVAYVSPSYYEGFCLPLVEAFACGCPVIGSTKGAMPEIIGDAGIVVGPTDTEALEQAMHDMAYNAKKRKEYVAKGLHQAQKYSWNSFAKAILREINAARKIS